MTDGGGVVTSVLMPPPPSLPTPPTRRQAGIHGANTRREFSYGDDRWKSASEIELAHHVLILYFMINKPAKIDDAIRNMYVIEKL